MIIPKKVVLTRCVLSGNCKVDDIICRGASASIVDNVESKHGSWCHKGENGLGALGREDNGCGYVIVVSPERDSCIVARHAHSWVSLQLSVGG